MQKKETNTVNGERHTVKPLDKLHGQRTMDTAVTATRRWRSASTRPVQIARHRTTTITVDDSPDVGGNKDDTVRAAQYVVNGGTKVQATRRHLAHLRGRARRASAASYIEFQARLAASARGQR